MRRWTGALLCLVMTACGSSDPGATDPTGIGTTSRPAGSTASSTGASPSPETTDPQADPDDLVLAFAGDSNAFQGGGASTSLGLGEAGRLLARADLASVNLETALADDPSGLAKQPKLYTFLTDRAFPQMLAREGVDYVSMANNHAMDYGVEGMERTLAIKQDLAQDLPMVGIGRTVGEAFAPVTLTAKGRQVIVHAGSDILEDNMDWYPGQGQPGVAMVKSPERFGRLVSAVRTSRREHPDAVIVVWMHWGVDYQVCTVASRQESRAQELADAGATVIVGTHAHRVQRITTTGSTLVAYGLGNFNFDSDRVATRETGVLTVRVPRRGTPRAQWSPGRIVGGRPQLLTGAQRQEALRRHATLPGHC